LNVGGLSIKWARAGPGGNKIFKLLIINVSDLYIGVISGGSCDTKDWSNDDKSQE